MRVTNRMISDNVYRNASMHLEKMEKLQNQLASGKAITKPSDDPTAVNQSMLLRNTLSDQDQFGKNINQAVTWLQTTDQTINSAQTVLTRARELATQGANGTNSQAGLDAIAAEVKQLKSELRGIANTQLAGRYLFNGSQTLQEPYPDFAAYVSPPAARVPSYPSPASTPIAGKLDNVDSLQSEIGPNVTIQYNVTGADVFGATTDPNNAFEVLDQLSYALEQGDTGTVSNLIGSLESRVDAMSLKRAELGGKENRADLLKQRYSDSEVSIQSLLSSYEDVDMPKVISQLNLSQTVYQASLAASAKIVQPTLMDFLK
ncbi:MAG TPA: flagellar hook-associated protein FlgL [Stenomitos sp.]